MRFGIRLGICIVLASSCTALCAAADGSDTSRAEKALFTAVNEARQAQGLPALQWNDALGAAARKHAAVMAQHGEAGHQFEGEASLQARVKQEGAHYSWVSENVCAGANTQSIHDEFLNSPKHRANILDTDMNSAGIGVVEHGGRLYAVEDFAQIK
jgi:uncharacterized protein YkwD